MSRIIFKYNYKIIESQDTLIQELETQKLELIKESEESKDTIRNLQKQIELSQMPKEDQDKLLKIYNTTKSLSMLMEISNIY